MAQCLREVVTYASLAQDSTIITAMMDHNTAHNVNAKWSDRQTTESKLRVFVLFNYVMQRGGEASARPSTRVQPLRGNGDHPKQCPRVALDFVDDTDIYDSGMYMLLDGGRRGLNTLLFCRVHSAIWNRVEQICAPVACNQRR